MAVNEGWTNSSDRCPVCLNAREDWIHPLICQSRDMFRKRDKLLTECEGEMKEFKTYPPLAHFIIIFFRNLYRCRIPDVPSIIDKNIYR